MLLLPDYVSLSPVVWGVKREVEYQPGSIRLDVETAVQAEQNTPTGISIGGSMVKKVLCSLALVAALSLVSLTASAQDIRATGPAAAVSERVIVPPSPGEWIAPLLVPQHGTTQPTRCSPCLWYGGDLNPSSSAAQGFANENTVLVSTTTTFAAFRVPAGQDWAATGAIVNVLSNNGGVLDPKQAVWAFTKGISNGNAGTTIATGTASAAVSATGRTAFGLTEYTVAVQFPKVALMGQGPAGSAYWVSVVPQCTNTGDSSCTSAEFFLSDTDLTNQFGPADPNFAGFFNSAHFSDNYAPLCTVNSLGCEWSSAGVLGTVQ